MSKNVVVTGGSGYIGSAVVRKLVERGDTVQAIVRSDVSAAKVEGLGATAVRGELTDAAVLTEAASGADGAIHLAATNDEHGATADLAAATALLAGLGGKPYVHTGGVWVYGDTDGVVGETAPFQPPAITSWRIANEEQVLASQASGGHPVVVMPGVVFGEGAGLIPYMFIGDDGVRYYDDGGLHWSLVHVEDIADLYLLALDGAAAGSTYVGASGIVTGLEAAEALTQVGDYPDATVSVTLADQQGRFGPLADAMYLDQQLSSAKAEQELGWAPVHADVQAALASGI